MLELKSLTSGYGPITAVRGLSLAVGDRQIVALLGANGAGKSTTLRTISGLVHPRAGTVTFQGRRIDRLSSAEIVAAGIVHCPEGRQIFPQLTVRENLRMGFYPRRDRTAYSREEDRVFGHFPWLRERLRQLAGTLSGGEQQMLAIARALMAGPRLLMLDEPSLGIAPIVVREIQRIIAEIRADGVGVLLVEQNAKMALGIADHAYVLELGEVVIEGPGKELREDARVQELYLGVRKAAIRYLPGPS